MTGMTNANNISCRTLSIEIEIPLAESISVTDDTLSVDLSDGRTISVPLAWYPRLLYVTPDERNNWRLIGKGYGIHWEGIDEDISIEELLAGKPSRESQKSLKKWLEARKSRMTTRSNLPLTTVSNLRSFGLSTSFFSL
jgi:hypothetical protein